MAVLYNSAPPPREQFRQGEVLGSLAELQFDATQVSEETLRSPEPPAIWHIHPWVIILSPDCDLEWDHKARLEQENIDTKTIAHVLLCDLEDLDALRQSNRVMQSRQQNLVVDNRDERYHHIPQAHTDSGAQLNEFFVDFKRTFSVPTDYLYALARQELVTRHGFLKAPWVQHLADRFTYFLGRVGLPDLDEPS